MSTPLSPSPSVAVSEREDPSRSVMALIGEVIDLTGGFAVAVLPFVATAVPGIFLFLMAPVIAVAVLAAIPAALVALLLGPPYLAIKAIRGRS